MKEAHEINPNYGPAYAAAMYPDLAKIFQSHGYALAVHGSLARDLDLIAVPWVPEVSPPPEVLGAVSERFSIRVSECSPQAREHGREAYTLIVGFGHCQIDLSFFPAPRTSPWPPRDVVGKLCEAASILLREKDYDGEGYELMDAALREARLFLSGGPA